MYVKQYRNNWIYKGILIIFISVLQLFNLIYDLFDKVKNKKAYPRLINPDDTHSTLLLVLLITL
ncbi:polyhydroxyalkanoate depolymerase, intracellular [Fructobacillus pseudoficulneus]|uniref:Polyhydroxyalkanoate depolymerase, intracellular n=1 Tax=Fructobacillus pseudoficulneus TaxID=220714 RepID=A0A3F3GTH1_9LACO|nr:polyhydroxyalkanoate depolymerase, intracellular [Fructobacillus pseudoficulneus]